MTSRLATMDATSPTPGPDGETGVHASSVAIGEAGILILGPSGSGKTTLAFDLLEASRSRGQFALLVSDDRTLIVTRGGRMIARPHAAIAGQYEQRGLGILQGPYEHAIVVRLAVWCKEGDGERFPAEACEGWQHGRTTVPMLTVGQNHNRTRLVLQYLEQMDTKMTGYEHKVSKNLG